MSDGWNLRAVYEKHLGSVALLVLPPGTTEPAAHFRLPLASILHGLGIPEDAVRQAALDAKKPATTTNATDLESILRRAIPEDCTGLSVLDAGGYDGRMAKVALDRGAASAICLDNSQYGRYGWTEPLRREGVEYREGDLLGWSEPVDVVLFFNVIYHVQDPWRTLAHLRSITRREMLLCSLVTWTDRPTWELYAPREVNPDDDTVYWGPSETGLRRLLGLTGWTDVEEVGKTLERLVLRCVP